MKQWGLAIHGYHDTAKCFPPALGTNVPGQPGTSNLPQGAAFGNGLFHLLAFVEQQNLYASTLGVGPTGVQVYYPFNNAPNGAYQKPLALFVCPSNPAHSNGTVSKNGTTWGASCYGFNALVFSKDNGITYTTASPGYIPKSPSSYDPAGAIKIAHITDGTSNTIVIAEKYPTCFNSTFAASGGEGGSYWAYAALSSPVLPAPNNGSPVANIPRPVYPGFAISFYASLPGGGSAIGFSSKFQSQPYPFDSGTNCNPALAQTPHPAAMPVCLADCTVRTISSAISPANWWAACTPSGNEVTAID
jgi:hypothetical protein